MADKDVTKILHFELDGKHYYGLKSWCSNTRYQINGIEASKGTEYKSYSWTCVDGPLKTFARYCSKTNIFRFYELRPEIKPTKKLPKRRMMKYFGKPWDDDHRLHADQFMLYQPVYKEIPERWAPADFVISEIRSRVVPRLPKHEGVEFDLCDMVALPEGLRSDRPCYMPAQAAFTVIVAEVKKHIPRPYKIRHDFSGWVKFEAAPPLPSVELRLYEHEKPRDWETGWIPTLYADSLDELEERIEQMVQHYLSLLESSQMIKCPLCNQGEVSAINAQRRLK